VVVGPVRTSLVVAVVLASGCLTTRPSLEPPVQGLEARMQAGEFASDTVTSQGDFIAKGTKTLSFDGFFANGQPVDELTIYHLAGDQTRRDEIVAYREQYNTAVMAGWGGSALGIGLVAAGGVMLAVLGSENPEAFIASQQGQIAFGLMTGGGIVLAGAPVVAITTLMPQRTTMRYGNSQGFSEDLLFHPSEASESIRQFETRSDGAATPGSNDDVTTPTETPADPPSGG
jgi:hypothetical protein